MKHIPLSTSEVVIPQVLDGFGKLGFLAVVPVASSVCFAFVKAFNQSLCLLSIVELKYKWIVLKVIYGIPYSHFYNFVCSINNFIIF